MANKKTPDALPLPASFPPNPVRSGDGQKEIASESKPTRKLDWLLIVMSTIFLLTLFIAWLVNIPNLLRYP